jgi:hypothetical protein
VSKCDGTEEMLTDTCQDETEKGDEEDVSATLSPSARKGLELGWTLAPKGVRFLT